MTPVLNLEPELRATLWAHLLPTASSKEQAAFLFFTRHPSADGVEFNVKDVAYMRPSDFAAQYEDYLELSDEARVGLIKRAHNLGAALAEFHSHPGPYPAMFSWSDRAGLKETVPHMRWRLKGQPYLAVVVAPRDFDALVWMDDSAKPQPLAGIRVGPTLLTPTNATLAGWSNEYRRTV